MGKSLIEGVSIPTPETGHFVLGIDSTGALQKYPESTFQGGGDGGNSLEFKFEANITQPSSQVTTAQWNTGVTVRTVNCTVVAYETKLATEPDSAFTDRANLAALETYMEATVAQGTDVVIRVSSVVGSNGSLGWVILDYTNK